MTRPAGWTSRAAPWYSSSGPSPPPRRRRGPPRLWLLVPRPHGVSFRGRPPRARHRQQTRPLQYRKAAHDQIPTRNYRGSRPFCIHLVSSTCTNLRNRLFCCCKNLEMFKRGLPLQNESRMHQQLMVFQLLNCLSGHESILHGPSK